MAKKDTRIDHYILKSQPFAQPVLIHLRELIHKVCPDVEETIKWGFPNFLYHDNILCNMAAFKQHCSFGFWLQSKLEDTDDVLVQKKEKEAMGSLGKITSVKDIPPSKIMSSYIKQAMKLIDAGVKNTKPKVTKTKEDIKVPIDLDRELKKNKKAKTTFDAFSNSHKREYIEWITEAKTEPTKIKRIATTIEMLEEGKSRNWKYQTKK